MEGANGKTYREWESDTKSVQKTVRQQQVSTSSKKEN